MTMQEVEDNFKFACENHTHVHLRTEFIDLESKVLMEAWDQIKRAVMLLDIQLIDPKDCRAEAVLLMFLQGCYAHGYTPNTKGDKK